MSLCSMHWLLSLVGLQVCFYLYSQSPARLVSFLPTKSRIYFCTFVAQTCVTTLANVFVHVGSLKDKLAE